MIVLLAIADFSCPGSYEAALREEGLEVRRETDIVRLMGTVDSSVLGEPAPDIVVLGGAPGPALAAAVAGIRKSPVGWSCRVMVMDGDIGLNEKCKIVRAGADDCQVKMLAAPLFAARVRTLLKREGSAMSGPLESRDSIRQLGPLVLDLLKRTAVLDGRPLRPTRIEFDVLIEIVRGKEAGALMAELLKGLRRRGHDVDAEAVHTCLGALNRELLTYKYEIRGAGEERWRLLQADSERRVPVLSYKFLEALGTAMSNVRLYRESHPGVSGFVQRAEELLAELFACYRSDRFSVTMDGGRVLINGRPHDPSVPTPPPVVSFMRAFRVGEIAIKRDVSYGELLSFCRLGKLTPKDVHPSRLANALIESGARSIIVHANAPASMFS